MKNEIIPHCIFSPTDNQWHCFTENDTFRVLNQKNINRIVIHPNQQQSLSRWIFFFIVFILLNQILLSIIHECGHAIMATIYHVEIVDISFFPATWILGDFSHGGLITLNGSDIASLEPYQIAIIDMSGSVACLLIGCLVLLFVISSRFDASFELWGVVFYIMAALEILSYTLVNAYMYFADPYSTDNGDWLDVYNIYPYSVYIIIAIDCVIVVVSILLLKKNLFSKILI